MRAIFEFDDAHRRPKFDAMSQKWERESGFTEMEQPNFSGSWYSRTRGYVDGVLQGSYPNALTLRLRMPISDRLDKKNFITKIANYERIINVPNSMSVLHDLIPLMLTMSKNKYTGVYNFTNPGVISHNQVMELYKKYIDPTKTWTNWTLEEQNAVLSCERSNNALDTTKLVKAAAELKTDLPHIRESVERVFQRMKQNIYTQAELDKQTEA